MTLNELQAETQETTADVSAEMRNYSNACNDGYHTDYRVVCADMRNFADRFDAAHKRELIEAVTRAATQGVKLTNEKHAGMPKKVDTRFDICQCPEQVLKIGRDFQNKDGFRGAHYDTVKLLCDTIEYQQEQLKKAKEEATDEQDIRD